MSIVQNDTSPIDFFMADNTDSSGETGKAGLLPAGITFKIAKTSGNFAVGTGTITAITNGRNGAFRYTPVAGDVATLGDVWLEASAAGCFTWADIRRVVQAGATDATATAIKAKTDNLPPDPADESLIIAATDALAASIAALNDVSAADLLAAVIETNGATTVTVKEALQLAAALPAGTVAGILAGAGAQTITVKSASGQDYLSIAGDELGNRVVTRSALT